MLRMFAALMVAVLVSACATSAPVLQDENVQHYSCDVAQVQTLAVEYIDPMGDRSATLANLVYDGDEYVMMREVSSAGEKFSDGHMTWSIEGERGRLESAGVLILRECLHMAST